MKPKKLIKKDYKDYLDRRSKARDEAIERHGDKTPRYRDFMLK